jgi:hypothetical protein
MKPGQLEAYDIASHLDNSFQTRLVKAIGVHSRQDVQDTGATNVTF